MESNQLQLLQKASSEKLETLIRWFTTLISSVKVTASTPIARTDPTLAVRTVATVCTKFHPGLIKKLIADMTKDPEAVWPTTGEITTKLEAMRLEYEAAIKNLQPTHAKKQAQHANINGWRYDQIMKRTKDGRAAMKAGKPNRFLRSLVEGKRELPPEMANPPK